MVNPIFGLLTLAILAYVIFYSYRVQLMSEYELEKIRFKTFKYEVSCREGISASRANALEYRGDRVIHDIWDGGERSIRRKHIAELKEVNQLYKALVTGDRI